MRGILRPLLTVSVLSSSALFGLSSAGATSANISHPYHFTGDVRDGSLVSLDPSRAQTVQPANSSNWQHTIGIAIANKDSLVAIDPSNDTIQVAVTGTANALVSTLQGPIKAGDRITASPFSGVGMKAEDGDPYLGTSETAFNDKSTGASVKNVADKNGRSHRIAVGYIRMKLSPDKMQSGGQTLTGLQRLGNSLAGHPVSTLRIVVSLIVAIVAIVVLFTLLYASIFGSVISISRNPMAKNAVLGSLTSVLGMAGMTVIIAAVTIFSLLH